MMDGGSWRCTGDRKQEHPQEKEMQKRKMAVRGGLTNSCENKRSQNQRRKGKICPFECRVTKNSFVTYNSFVPYKEGKIRKPFSVINTKK